MHSTLILQTTPFSLSRSLLPTSFEAQLIYIQILENQPLKLMSHFTIQIFMIKISFQSALQ